MSNIITSCSPGTKCDYINNDQGTLCFFKLPELDRFLNDENARSLNDTGAYIIYSSNFKEKLLSYSGESTTEDSGGVLARLKEHIVNKPDLTNCMVLFNATIDGHRKYESNTFKLLEHIFKVNLLYANKSEVINIKRTGGSVSPEVYQKIICPTLVELKYRAESVLANILVPENDLPSKTKDSKSFINNSDITEIYLRDDVILKNSQFKFPYKKIRESNECYTLFTNLINAGLCIPYVSINEVVMKFVTDVNLGVAHVINNSQRKDFFISERLLVNLMGSTQSFKNSFK